MDFNNLSDELKAKVKECTSPEDILKLAKEEGFELTDEQLEDIAGGWEGCPEYEPCGYYCTYPM